MFQGNAAQYQPAPMRIAQGRQFIGQTVRVRLDVLAIVGDPDPFQLQSRILAQADALQQMSDVHAFSSNRRPCWGHGWRREGEVPGSDFDEMAFTGV
jgi:hypothetical protein